MKAIIVQKDINDSDYEAWLDRLQADSPDAVLFSELSATGCLYEPQRGKTTRAVTDGLKSFSFDIGLGFPRESDDGLYNSYLYWSDGAYQLYDKTNLFSPMNEDRVYRPGEEPVVFDTRFGKVGIAICYDLRFPALFDKLASLGAEIILVPAAFPRVRIHDWRELLVQRAGDNGLMVIGINAVGDDGVNEFGGSSMIVDKDGRVLARADETSQTTLEVEL